MVCNSESDSMYNMVVVMFKGNVMMGVGVGAFVVNGVVSGMLFLLFFCVDFMLF